MMKQQTLLSLTLLVGICTASPLSALAQTTPNNSDGTPLLTQATQAELIAAGCELIPLTDTRSFAAARSLGWRGVVASNATGEALAFCPPPVAANLEPPREGRVAAATANAQIGGVAVEAGVGALFPFTRPYIIAKNSLEALNKGTTTSLGGTFALISHVGFQVFASALYYIVPLLTVSGFVTSAAVRAVWPVVLGFTNLGFLLALVLIALFTALRLDVGGGVRRLLPRLLIAALLVNFSLVIAGFILDISRVAMAPLPFIFEETNIDTFVNSLQKRGYDSTGALAVRVEKSFDAKDWERPAGQLLSAVITWVLAIAALAVVFGLAMRVFVLLLLLMTSPVAYLLIALPNADQLAKRWWSLFLRYVIYGPVVLVLLLLAVQVNVRSLGLEGFFVSSDRALLHITILNAIIFVGGLILAAMAGRYAGIVGSAAAIGLATRTGKRIRGAAYRGVRGTVRGTAQGLYVGSGTRAAVRGGRNQVRDFGGGIRTALGKRFQDATGIKLAKRDRDGRLAKGQTSAAEKLGQRLGGGKYTQQQQAQQRQAVTRARGAGHAGITYSDLSREHTGVALAQDEGRTRALRDKATHGSRAEVRAMVRNPELVRGLSEDQVIDIQANIHARADFNADSDKNAEIRDKLVEQLQNTLDKLNSP